MPNTTMFIENYKSFIKKRNNNQEGKSLQSVKKSINSYINDNKNRVINSFILFGCWNHIDCFSKNYKKHPIYRDIVIKKIKSEKEKLIIVAGDNWYSQNYLHNNIVYKYYPYSVLTSGYSLLFKNTSKNIDIILGNHDENNDNIYTDSLNLKRNCMLKTQKYVIEQLANNEKILDIPTLETLENQTLDNLSVNNINLFTCIDKPVIKELNKLVYVLYINTNLFDNFTYKTSNDNVVKIMISYVNYIDKLLKIYRPSLLFVVGHNPLVAYKNKKYHKLGDIYKDSDNSYIMELFITILNKYKTIYLCADVHTFNIALLNKNLGTVISGTGGGSPDVETKEGKVNLLISPNDNIFDIKQHYVYNAYGYTKIKYDKDFNVYVTYKQLFNAYTDANYKFKQEIIEKPISVYNFVFKNTINGWKLEKLKDRESHLKLKLNVSQLLQDKLNFCKKIKSNHPGDENILDLISKNELVYSTKKKKTYINNDVPLLCYYKGKKYKSK